LNTNMPSFPPPEAPIADPGFVASTRRARFPWLGPVLAVGGILAFFAITSYRFDYVAILPGRADAVNERLKITGAKTYEAKGKIMWATVGLRRGLSVFDFVDAWLSNDTDVFKRKEILGDESNAQSEKRSSAEMDDAKLVARVTVARKLGFPTKDGGAEILDLEPLAPASKLLKATDLIVSADGHPVCLQGDLGEVVRTKKPGDAIVLGVRRVTSAKGAALVRSDEQDIEVQTYRPKGVNRAYIGVVLGPAKEKPCSFPFTVDIDTDRIGGPSAGLAMTLAMIDKLTPGELTGGLKVAVTGTIESNGDVGEIGGVKQKTAAVKAAGAKLFIVPAAEYGIAKKQAGSMQIVGVKTLDEALAALRSIGGEPLPNKSK
jgi:Lon-like protease